MIPPKFAIGQSVYTFSLFTARLILDRYWDADRETWRYKIENHARWVFEEVLKTEEEVREILGDEPNSVEDDEDFEDYGYDGDTGREFVDGQWRVANSDQWERFQHS